MRCLPLALMAICTGPIMAASLPESAHTSLYFPHLADGGTAAFKFQTAITILNPNSSGVNVAMQFLKDDGSALALDFGQGPVSILTLSLPSGGSRTLRSAATANVPITGWARAVADLPIQGTVQFRSIVNGVAQQEISAVGTLPSQSYISPANALLGVAIANVYPTPLQVVVSAFDTSGSQVAATTVTVDGGGHRSFNLNSVLPGLSASFAGSIRLTPVLAGAYIQFSAGWSKLANKSHRSDLRCVLQRSQCGPIFVYGIGFRNNAESPNGSAPYSV